MPSPVTDTPSDPLAEKRAQMFIATFRSMVYGRAFEDKLASLYRAGKIVGGVYLGRGPVTCPVSGAPTRCSSPTEACRPA